MIEQRYHHRKSIHRQATSAASVPLDAKSKRQSWLGHLGIDWAKAKCPLLMLSSALVVGMSSHVQAQQTQTGGVTDQPPSENKSVRGNLQRDAVPQSDEGTVLEADRRKNLTHTEPQPTNPPKESELKSRSFDFSSALALGSQKIEQPNSKLVISLGKLRLGSTTHFRLPIENACGYDLTLAEVKSTCGCTVGIPRTRVLTDRKTTDLGIVFRSQSTGFSQKNIALIFEDFKAQPLQLVLESNSQPLYVLDQETIKIHDGQKSAVIQLSREFAINDGEAPTVEFEGLLLADARVHDWENESGSIHLVFDEIGLGKKWVREQVVITVKDEQTDPSRFIISVQNEDSCDIRPKFAIAQRQDGILEFKVLIRGDAGWLNDDSPISVQAVTDDEIINGQLTILKSTKSLIFAKVQLRGASSLSDTQPINLRWSRRSDGQLVETTQVTIQGR